MRILPANFRPIAPLLARGAALRSLLRIGGIVLTIVLVGGLAHAQSGSSDRREAVSDRQAAPFERPAAPHYDVVALRVEFQPDTTRFTTGDGTFGEALFDSLRPSIDPLPHDADYFRAHLDFLEHYVADVSDGATKVTAHLVPEVVRLPNEMAQYSPTGPEADSPDERVKMARLVRDAWERADEEVDFDMSRFDPDRTALILFHAGVGRDVELTGTTLRKTPEDLPSLYMGTERLTTLLDDLPRFDGFPVRHSIVLPETETRIGDDPITGEPFLAEFSFNGLMAASFFNYLGVPDLFDTETGRSGIGPFGLMDPMGIFAYRGLFPPEPTAWTKVFLGWIDPPTRRPDPGGRIELPAEGGGETAVRVPISAGEYFLLENRHRDPGGDGLELTVWENGTTRTVRIDRAEEEFSRFGVEAFPGGVVTGVSDYDWAVPGAPAESDSLLLGGTAVWHVDERIVRNRIAANRVNVDPERRGVDLEEADGVQDIGKEAVGTLGSGVERGTPFDLYFRGNPVRVVTEGDRPIRLYENRFGPETRPSSRSNRGGPGFVLLEEFSGPGPVMGVDLRVATGQGVARIRAWSDLNLGPGFGRGGDLLLPPAGSSDRALYAVEDTARAGRRLVRIHPSGGGDEGARVETLATGVLGRPAWMGAGWGAVVEESAPGRWSFRLPDGRRVDPPGESENPGRPVGDPVVLGSRPDQDTEAPELFQLARSDSETRLIRVSEGGSATVVGRYPELRGRMLVRGGPAELVIVGEESARQWRGDGTWSWPDGGREEGSGGAHGAAFGRSRDGTVGVVVDTVGGRIRWLFPDGATERIDVDPGVSPPVLGDLDADGHVDVLVATGSSLRAYTQEGAPVEGFPIEIGAPATGTPLLLRREAAGSTVRTVVATGRDGYAYGVRPGERTSAPGYPLAVGRVAPGAVAAHDTFVTALSGAGELQAWRFDGAPATGWTQRLGNARNQRYVAFADGSPRPPSASDRLINAGRSYVWPNPVRSEPAHVRVTCRRACRVEATVVDLSGMRVDHLDGGEQRAGVPRDLPWDASVSSGVYYLRIRARGASGGTDTLLLRLAVVR